MNRKNEQQEDVYLYQRNTNKKIKLTKQTNKKKGNKIKGNLHFYFFFLLTQKSYHDLVTELLKDRRSTGG